MESNKGFFRGSGISSLAKYDKIILGPVFLQHSTAVFPKILVISSRSWSCWVTCRHQKLWKSLEFAKKTWVFFFVGICVGQLNAGNHMTLDNLQFTSWKGQDDNDSVISKKIPRELVFHRPLRCAVPMIPRPKSRKKPLRLKKQWRQERFRKRCTESTVEE